MPKIANSLEQNVVDKCGANSNRANLHVSSEHQQEKSQPPAEGFSSSKQPRAGCKMPNNRPVDRGEGCLTPSGEERGAPTVPKVAGAYNGDRDTRSNYARRASDGWNMVGNHHVKTEHLQDIANKLLAHKNYSTPSMPKGRVQLPSSLEVENDRRRLENTPITDIDERRLYYITDEDTVVQDKSRARRAYRQMTREDLEEERRLWNNRCSEEEYDTRSGCEVSGHASQNSNDIQDGGLEGNMSNGEPSSSGEDSFGNETCSNDIVSTASNVVEDMQEDIGEIRVTNSEKLTRNRMFDKESVEMEEVMTGFDSASLEKDDKNTDEESLLSPDYSENEALRPDHGDKGYMCSDDIDESHDAVVSQEEVSPTEARTPGNANDTDNKPNGEQTCVAAIRNMVDAYDQFLREGEEEESSISTGDSWSEPEVLSSSEEERRNLARLQELGFSDATIARYARRDRGREGKEVDLRVEVEPREADPGSDEDEAECVSDVVGCGEATPRVNTSEKTSSEDGDDDVDRLARSLGALGLESSSDDNDADMAVMRAMSEDDDRANQMMKFLLESMVNKFSVHDLLPSNQSDSDEEEDDDDVNSTFYSVDGDGNEIAMDLSAKRMHSMAMNSDEGENGDSDEDQLKEEVTLRTDQSVSSGQDDASGFSDNQVSEKSLYLNKNLHNNTEDKSDNEQTVEENGEELNANTNANKMLNALKKKKLIKPTNIYVPKKRDINNTRSVDPMELYQPCEKYDFSEYRRICANKDLRDTSDLKDTNPYQGVTFSEIKTKTTGVEYQRVMSSLCNRIQEYYFYTAQNKEMESTIRVLNDAWKKHINIVQEEQFIEFEVLKDRTKKAVTEKEDYLKRIKSRAEDVASITTAVNGLKKQCAEERSRNVSMSIQIREKKQKIAELEYEILLMTEFGQKTKMQVDMMHERAARMATILSESIIHGKKITSDFILLNKECVEKKAKYEEDIQGISKLVYKDTTHVNSNQWESQMVSAIMEFEKIHENKKNNMMSSKLSAENLYKQKVTLNDAIVEKLKQEASAMRQANDQHGVEISNLEKSVEDRNRVINGLNEQVAALKKEFQMKNYYASQEMKMLKNTESKIHDELNLTLANLANLTSSLDCPKK